METLKSFENHKKIGIMEKLLIFHFSSQFLIKLWLNLIYIFTIQKYTYNNMENSKSSENYKKKLRKKNWFQKKKLWKKKLLALRADKKCYRPAGPIKSVIGPEKFHEKKKFWFHEIFFFNFLIFLCIHEKITSIKAWNLLLVSIWE